MRQKGYYWAKDDKDRWEVVHWEGQGWLIFQESQILLQREIDLIFCYISETPLPEPA